MSFRNIFKYLSTIFYKREFENNVKRKKKIMPYCFVLFKEVFQENKEEIWLSPMTKAITP